MEIKFHDVAQNSDEWDALRAGRITSSSLHKVMANFGKAFGEPAKKYAVDIAVAQITGKPASGNYSNSDMERGHEEEPLARMAYEERYFCTVDNGGFFELGDIGCSPDGLVDSDGAIEIKSAIPSIHYARIAKQSYDTSYKWQLIGNMKFTGRSYIDFASYCSSFPDDQKLYVHRSHRDEFVDEFEMIDERIDLFRKLIKETKETILNNSYSVIKAA